MKERLPVFVYGTLLPGHYNHDRLLHGHFEDSTPAVLSDYDLHFAYGDGGFPAIRKGTGRVKGVLFYLTPAEYEARMLRLDRLEGYDEEDEAVSMYLRRKATVLCQDGTHRQAWVYIWNRHRIGAAIENGDYNNPIIVARG